MMASHPAAAQTNFTLLMSFPNSSSGLPDKNGLFEDTNHVLYGTTLSGGSAGMGTVFRMQRDGSGFVLLKSFTAVGTRPRAELVEGDGNALYGTSDSTVYKINKDGSGYSVLHNFQGGSDGDLSSAALVLGDDGAFYGTTRSGGISNVGTIFRITSDGSNYAVLHDFAGSDGAGPRSRLLKGWDGFLYGTANNGSGTNGGGTVFKISQDGSGFTVLHGFATNVSNGEGAPYAGWIQGSDGMLYGTVNLQAGNTRGSVFTLSTNGSGYTVLRHFALGTEPQFPIMELVEGTNGVLYGCSGAGGATNKGTVFKLNKDGSGFEILKHFTGTGGDGNIANNGLLLGSDGVLYGMTFIGGDFNRGCTFAISTAPLPPRVLSFSTYATSNVVQCAGTSAIQYDVQRSTNLMSWSLMGTLTAPVNGRFSYSDPDPPQPAAFYRLKQH